MGEKGMVEGGWMVGLGGRQSPLLPFPPLTFPKLSLPPAGNQIGAKHLRMLLLPRGRQIWILWREPFILQCMDFYVHIQSCQKQCAHKFLDWFRDLLPSISSSLSSPARPWGSWQQSVYYWQPALSPLGGISLPTIPPPMNTVIITTIFINRRSLIESISVCCSYWSQVLNKAIEHKERVRYYLADFFCK